MLQVTFPFGQFLDTSGNPLDNGYVYVGTANLNPETNPVSVYWDDDLTIPAAQPIRTINGYLSRNGSPARLYTSASIFSITVRDKTQAIVASALDASSLDNLRADLALSSGSSLSGFIQAGTGAVATTAQAKMREWVTVSDFSTLQVAVDAGHTLIRIPQGVNVATTTNISLPAGVNLQVDGIVSGTGRLDFVGSCKLFGCGSITCGSTWSISVAAGDVSIKDLSIGKAATHGILVFPTANITSLRIQDCTIVGAKYGILRNVNGTDFAVFNAHIEGNTIADSTGDGIEWNICHLDRRVKIANNIVTNTSGSVANSGIGIGVAGKAYSHTSDFTNYTQQITITDNTVRGARQGIHVEAAARIKISGNDISDCTASYGDASITTYGMAVYALEQAHITDNMLYDNTSGINLFFGVTGGVFTGSPRDVVISGNTLINSGNLRTLAAKHTGQTTAPLIAVKNNVVIGSHIRHEGVCNYVCDGNTMKPTAGNIGFYLDYYYAANGADYLPVGGYILKLMNNQVFDELNRVNVTIQNVSHPSGYDGNFGVFQSGNSFTVTVADTAHQAVNRIVHTSEAGLGGAPYGVEYQIGTTIIDTATPARYVVTVAGSRNRAADTYTVTDAANGIIQSSSLTWAAGSHHTLGQAITLTDGVIAPIACFVGTVYITGGNYRMTLVDSANVAKNLGALGAGTITATTALTTVTV